MIRFTDRSGELFELVLDLALTPGAALRISLQRKADAALEEARLRLTTTAEFRKSDELVLAPGGVPMFISPDLAPLLEDCIIDGSLNADGRPNIAVHMLT